MRRVFLRSNIVVGGRRWFKESEIEEIIGIC